MSDNKSPFDLNGSFGDFRSYYDPATGKRINARKGGPTPEQFRNDPKYARARERSNEFGGRSKWSSLLKTSLLDLGHLMHVRCFNKIMAAGRLIQQAEVDGLHGYRTISVNNNPGALPLIEFNERHPFRSVIHVAYEALLSPDKTTVTLSIPGFVTSKDVQWESKFYAVRLYLVIAQLSDFNWNPVLEIYEPVVPDLELLSVCTVSDWMFLNSEPTDVLMKASFEKPAFTFAGTSVIVAMGVEFSASVVMRQPYVTPRSGSVAIVGCFTK